MALLIDGYNLLNATGIMARGRGPQTLQRTRRALLNFLSAYLASDLLDRTTVVFDARGAPPGLPKAVRYRGMTVRYARGYADADTLIEELIRADNAPRQLTVVSSDHRIQRAARRRKATAIDSDQWYAQLGRQACQPDDPQRELTNKPPLPSSDEEVQQWLQFFGDIDQEELTPPRDVPTSATAARRASSDAPAAADPSRDELAHPFPPGYGEDLLGDEDDLQQDVSPDGG